MNAPDLMPGQSLILFTLAATLCFLYFVAPGLAALRFSLDARPTTEIIDIGLYPLPPAFRERLAQDQEQLLNLGFKFRLAFLFSFSAASTETICATFSHPDLPVSASVLAVLLVRPQGFVLNQMGTFFNSLYLTSEECELNTSNTDSALDLRFPPNVVSTQFPHVSNVSRLLTVHRLLEQRHFRGLPHVLREADETPERLRDLTQMRLQKFMDYWIQTGQIRPNRGKPGYQFPVWFVYALCWARCLPLGPILKALRYWRARRLERQLLSNADILHDIQ